MVGIVKQMSLGAEVAGMRYRVYRGGGAGGVGCGNKGTAGGCSIWQHRATFPGGSFTSASAK